MKVQKSKSIDEIFEEVKDYDLVLTVHGPLADALNGRIEEPRLDKFAITPRRLVSDNFKDGELARKEELFLKLVDSTEFSWKESHYLLENLISCWRKTGKLENILDYEDFDSSRMEKVIEIVKEVPNIFSEMNNFEFREGISVCVVGYYQFEELDKEVLPENFDTVEIFKNDLCNVSRFNIFGTTTSLVNAISDNLEKEICEDVAVIVPEDNEYENLVKAMLSSRGIPYVSRINLSDSEDLRTFMVLLEVLKTEDRLRVKEIRPILTRFGIEIPIKHNDEFLKDLDTEKVINLRKEMEDLKNSTFGEVLSFYEDFAGKQEEIGKELDRLEVYNEEINQENINKVRYFLDSFDIELEEKNRGVLFASPKSAPFVDRSIIFYLGMDSSWTSSPPDKPWVNEGDFHSERINDFKILLQNGNHQYFMVRDNSMGEKINPCLYFSEVTEESFDSFSEMQNDKFWTAGEKERLSFEKETFDVKIRSEKAISQSDLNKLVQSPRQYFFSKLVGQEEKIYLKKGSLFHDFAEFYVNCPDFVDDNDEDEFVDLMIEEISPLSEDFLLKKLRTDFRIGIESIIEYLDIEELPDFEFEEYGNEDRKNIFSEKFGKNLEKSITEAAFENEEIGARGKVDLIKSGDHLVDYKSGRKKSERKIVTSSKVDLFEDDPNFQALLYLTHHRRVAPDKELKFTFYHFMENLEDKISGDYELSDNIVTITYYPDSFKEKLLDEDIFEKIIGDVSPNNNRRKTLEKLGFRNYSKFLENNEIPDIYDREQLLDSEFVDEFIKFSKDKVGDYKYVKEGCIKTVKKFLRFRKENYFKEDLDSFESFLDEQLGKLNDYKQDRFPVGNVDVEDLENQDLIIGDDIGTE